MIEIKCPKCGSEYFDCHDTEFNDSEGVAWALCYCEDCGTEFDIKYKAVEINVVD